MTTIYAHEVHMSATIDLSSAKAPGQGLATVSGAFDDGIQVIVSTDRGAYTFGRWADVALYDNAR